MLAVEDEDIPLVFSDFRETIHSDEARLNVQIAE
jgi:hypothetical protein